MDNWRIKRIAYDQFGNSQYQRVYGWGWLGLIGALAMIVGAVGFAVNVKIDDGWLVGSLSIGMIIMWTGLLLNGFSKRKSMSLIDAKCIDVQVNYIGATMKRSANWAVRALVEYEYEGEMHQSTPMPSGYAVFLSEDSAAKFSKYILDSKSIKLYVDPKRPKRSLFHDLNAA